jgi:hypothetical protein
MTMVGFDVMHSSKRTSPYVDTPIKCTFYLFLFFTNFLRLDQTKISLLLLN